MARACSICHQKAEDRLRSTLKNDFLDALLQVSINGPGVKDGHPLITTAVKEWLAKPRGKIAKVPPTEVQQPVKMPVFKWTLRVRKLKGCGELQRLRWIS